MPWNRRLVMIVALALRAAALAQTNAAYSESDELRRTFDLGRTPRVEVSGMMGTVEVTTHDAPTVDVLIVRSAESREELECGMPLLVHDESRLTIVGAEKINSSYDGRKTHHKVTLVLPRSASLLLDGITGRVSVEPIEGDLVLRNIYDPERVQHDTGAQSRSPLTKSLWAGPSALVLGIAKKGGPIRIHNVNGDIRLTVTKSARIDFSLTEHTGAVSTAGLSTMSPVGNMDVFREPNGRPITLSGIIGLVQLTRLR